MSFELTGLLFEIIGLKLDAARTALAGNTPDGSTPGVAIEVVETSAPPRKNNRHTFGDWRVLRVRRIENEIENSVLELTVARELLEHAPRET